MQEQQGGRQPGQWQAQAEGTQDRQGEAAGGPCPEGVGSCWRVAFLFRGPKRRPREKSIQLQDWQVVGEDEGERMGGVGGMDYWGQD